MSRAIVIGAGHNGLVCAAYLARAGFEVTVVERREIIGGASVTEELWPGFRVSRAAYVVGLLRPAVARELDLARFGLKLLPRNPSSFTPLPDGRCLILSGDLAASVAQIARFSRRDAEAYPAYEAFIGRVAAAVEPLLDLPPPELPPRRLRDLRPWWRLLRAAVRLRRDVPRTAALLLGPARDTLEQWLESEPLRATLATDAIIGAFASPSSPGTGYVLFHHVMGSVTGHRGVWAYAAGGIGAVCDALAAAALEAGAHIRTGAEVIHIRLRDGRATGVVLDGGEEIEADIVVSSADPARTFFGMVGAAELPDGFVRGIGRIDYRSPVFKLNLALSRLPVFRGADGGTVPLCGTIHIGSETLDAIDRAFADAASGDVSQRPVVELTIPSVLDPALAPPGCHVASIFAQYAPALGADDPRWGEILERARDRILAVIEEVAPGFRDSILHMEILGPPELERIFALTGGNIFHGAMTPDRLLFLRPLAGWASYRTPIANLYLCGAGTHPGGGIMGACGRNAAATILASRR